MEKLRISSKVEIKWAPSSRDELAEAIEEHINDKNFDGYLDLRDIDVSSITNCDGLFMHKLLTSKRCDITMLDVTGWDVSKITNFTNMFAGIKNAEDIIGLQTWKMNNATTISGMFTDCNSIKHINVTGWDLEKCQNASYVFSYCTNLETIIGIDTWKLSNQCTTLGAMFNCCYKLKSLNLSKWDVSSVEWFSSMFKSCHALTSIDLSSWKTDKMYSTTFMFSACINMAEMLGIDKWDLSNCADMTKMFIGCVNLSTIGIFDKLNLSRVVSTESMFESCSNLELDASRWIYRSTNKRKNMFRYTSRKKLIKT